MSVGPYSLVDRRCVNCRHARKPWREVWQFAPSLGRPPRRMLACEAITFGDGRLVELVTEGYVDSTPEVHVAPSFGCVLWEAKGDVVSS